MKSRRQFFLWLIYLAFLFCLLPVAVFTYKHPSYNFDMLGYMAIIVRMDKTKSIDEVHAITYREARRVIPAEKYIKLTSTPAFRKKFATEPSQFERILPMYAVKPLYIWMSRLFYKAGFSLPAATVMPSILSYLLIGLFLFYWLQKYLPTANAFAGGLLFLYTLVSVAPAGLSTPDCLSALFLFLSAYFIIEKRQPGLMFFFLLLAIFTRIDNIITCFFIISFLTFVDKHKTIKKAQFILMLVILAISYISIVLPATQAGWNLFYYSQFSRQLDFSWDFDQALSFSSYLRLVESKLVTALVSSHFTFFLLLGLLISGSQGISVREAGFDRSFLLVLLSVTFFRFLLLPDLSDRFYFGFYLVIIMLLVRKLSPRISTVSNEDR